jgi:monoamine oxidase
MNVAVIGVGIAGLRCMQLLEQAGHRATGFEARARIGGRLHTLQFGHEWVEMGGEWVDADHVHALRLLDELGIEPRREEDGDRWVIFRNEQTTLSNLWADVREDLDRFEHALRTGKHGDGADVTLSVWLNDHAQSERGRWFLENRIRSDEGDDVDRIGLRGWLRFHEQYADREGDEMSAFRLPRGWTEALLKMQKTVLGPIHLSQSVIGLEIRDTGVEVRVASGTHVFDAAIVTLPPAVLRSLEIRPEPVRWRNAWQSIPMGRVIKIALHFRSRWWTRVDWHGHVHWDSPLQQLWPSGSTLLAYVSGADAVRWTQSKDPVLEALEQISGVWPQARQEFVEGRMMNWIDDPWSCGGFPIVPPGAAELLPILRQPLQRVVFAGDATSDWIGFVEGALQSAERAVNQLADL